MTMALKRWAMLAAICAFPVVAQAQVSVADAFSKGRLHGIVTAGSGSAFNETYLVLGAGVSYFVLDGLSVGLSLEAWRNADPSLTKLTPSIQYVFYQVPAIKPYLGAFYRRTYISGLDDLNSYGARAGAYFQLGRNAFLGVGGVHETYSDCRESTYRSCSDTYPEVSLTFAF
jgi:hypothetical protein